MTIKGILDFVNYISNKEQMGQSLTPENFNVLLAGFNIKIFNDELTQVEVMAKTQGIPMYRALYAASSLRKFRTLTTLQTDAQGIASLPTDYVHFTKLLAQYNGAIRTIDVVSEEEMANKRSSMMETSLSIKPACTMYGTQVQFFPKDIGHSPNPNVELKYIKMPAIPNYDWCISNVTGSQVFMPVGSYVQTYGGATQNLYAANGDVLARDVELRVSLGYLPYTSFTVELEWDEIFQWKLITLLLTAMGVNLKDEQIRSYKEGN